MNAILAMPMELRLAILFALGACMGAAANATAAFASAGREWNPWFDHTPQRPLRRWLRRVPIVGWFIPASPGSAPVRALRPLAVEIIAGFLIAWLYWWEVGCLALLPPGAAPFAPPHWTGVAHAQYLSHAILLGLMLVASLIDLDEKIIPDSVTVPGTLVGLLLVVVLPQSLLPDVWINGVGQPVFDAVRLNSPHQAPAWLGGWPHAGSLALALGCWAAWGFALLPRTWYTRHGLGRAMALCAARVRRERVTWVIAAASLAGAGAIAAVWLAGGPAWDALLTALVGLAAGGAMIWAVRAIGYAALRREAMGFGDVTLMAMIGTFLGWQACLMVFFLAPLAGLLAGVLQWVVRRDNEIPYGPFLCLAALFVVARWATLWAWLADVLALGWFVPLMLLACLLLMVVLLRAIHRVREHFERRR